MTNNQKRQSANSKTGKKQSIFTTGYASKLPKHVLNLSLIVKNNAEIRRFTSLGIINYLYQKGVIDTRKVYVNFMFDKFAVIKNNLATEYSYTEPFFINCMIASFTSFANAAQRIINEFCKQEIDNRIGNVADEEEIKNIVKANEEHVINTELAEKQAAEEEAEKASAAAAYEEVMKTRRKKLNDRDSQVKYVPQEEQQEEQQKETELEY